MARPQKEGLDYFPFDVDFFSDDKIRILRGAYGNDGVTLYIYMLARIYKNNGYYLRWTDEVAELTASDLGISADLTRQIVAYLAKRSLVDSTLFSSVTVLTSPGIQRRFQLGVKTRAKKNAVKVERDLWLLDDESTEPFITFTDNISYSRNNQSFSRNNGSFSREESLKKSKEKKSKGKERTTTTPAQPEPPTAESSLLSSELISLFEKEIGRVTDAIRTGLDDLVKQDGEAKVMEAVRIAAENNHRNLGYVKGILKNWRDGTGRTDAGKPRKTFNYTQRDDIDYDELERELAARPIKKQED